MVMTNLDKYAPCSCGSGKKLKFCCLGKSTGAGNRVVERNGERFLASRGVDSTAIDAAAAFYEQKARVRGPAQQLVDFAQPLLDAAGDDEKAQERAFSLAMLFWNMAISKSAQSREELLTDVMTKAMALNEEDQKELRGLADMMVERHRQMFPEMHGGR